MNKTAEELLALKKSFSGVPDFDGAKLEMAVANFDDEKVRAKLSKNIVGEVWDRTSPINGVPADEVAEIYDLSDTGSIFIVRDGDQVLQFQYHDPDEEGYVEMNGSRSKSLANKAAQEIVEHQVDQELRMAILKEATG